MFFFVFYFVFRFLVNLCTLGYSISVGWTASSFLIYDSDDCPLPTGRLSMNEIAWIGSVLGIGGLIGTILVGWIADRIGRKNSLLALAVPQIVSSMLMSNFQVFLPTNCIWIFSTMPNRSVSCLWSTHKMYITCIFRVFLLVLLEAEYMWLFPLWSRKLLKTGFLHKFLPKFSLSVDVQCEALTLKKLILILNIRQMTVEWISEYCLKLVKQTTEIANN